MNRKRTSSPRVREAWLQQAVQELRLLFKRHDVLVPETIRTSMGFPYRARKAVAQCWSNKCSADGTWEIFISPTEAKAEDVLDHLSHELVHATVGTSVGHKKPFVDCAAKIGLTEGSGKTLGAGSELKSELHRIAVKLGKFPHAPLIPSTVIKQTTRLVKTFCPECDYVARVTRIHLDDKGAPICPVCRVSFVEEIKE